MKTIDDFFADVNKISSVTEDDYRNVAHLITALEAVARMTYQSLYVVDYYARKFLYVSDNPLFLCGCAPEAVREAGYGFYLQHVPEREHDMLLEINRAGFEFCARVPVEDRTKYTISYNFHILNDRRETLINHKLTPLALSGDGAVWLAACTVSLSSRRDKGHVEARKTGAADCWNYSLERHRWERADSISLSDREKDILLLSAQGCTMRDIAAQLYISVSTVKFYKARLFERLRANNIAEALSIASSHGMF
jgi:DNA-binding CsgD family transcriptional regulator